MLRYLFLIFQPSVLGVKLLFSVSSCVFQREQIRFLTLGYTVNLKVGHVGGVAIDGKNFFSECPAFHLA